MTEGVIMSGVSTPSGTGYAVGGFPNSGTLLRFDDQAWVIETEFDRMLHWVHAIDQDLWLVGAGGLIVQLKKNGLRICLLYTSPSPRDKRQSRMPSSA